MLATAEILGSVQEFLEAARTISKWRRLAKLERWLTKKLALAFRAQGREVARLFTQKYRWRFAPEKPLREAEPLSQEEWEQLFALLPPEMRELFEGPLEDGIKAALLAGGADTIKSLGVRFAIDFNLQNPRAIEYLKARAADLVKGIDETTRSYLRTTVAQGAEKGWGYNKIAQTITRRYREFAVGKPQAHIESRAHLIAVTELGNAYEDSSRTVVGEIAELGITMEKSWLTVGDDKVSAGCRANAAAGWIDYNDPFPSGHQCPLRFPGCRCSALYRMKKGVKPAPPSLPVPQPPVPQKPPKPTAAADVRAELIKRAKDPYALARAAYWERWDDYAAIVDQHGQESQQAKAALAEVQKLEKAAEDAKDQKAATAQELRELLSADEAANVSHTTKLTGERKKTVKEAFDAFAVLLGAGKLEGANIKVVAASRRRSSYNASDGVKLAAGAEGRVVVHELGHWFEEKHPGVLEKAREFFEKRTAGEKDEPLRKLVAGANYRSDERARKDKFLSPYMGKVYRDSKGEIVNTELVSMGLELMYADPVRLARDDPEYFDFIWDLIRG